MGKDKERGLLLTQQVRPEICHIVQQSGYLSHSASPDTTWQMSHCHSHFQKTVFLLRSCPMYFRHIAITVSLNMSKIWLYSSQFGMVNIQNWHQEYLRSSHLSSEDSIRCKKVLVSLISIVFPSIRWRYLINLWFSHPLKRWINDKQKFILSKNEMHSQN